MARLYRLLNSAVICCYLRGNGRLGHAFLKTWARRPCHERNEMLRYFVLVALLWVSFGCAHKTSHVGQQLTRSGDEIVVAGQFFHTGVPVVTWMDPGGYDAYRVERRFAPWDRSDFQTTREEALENKRLNRPGTEVTSPNRY